MADIIKMLLQAKIDTDNSIDDINKQIEALSQRSDLKKLDLKININPETIKSIDELNKKLSELGGKNIQQGNIKGVVQDFSVLQGQIDDLIKEYSKFGTVTSNLNFDQNKKLQSFTIQVKDAQENIQKFKYELENGIFELKNIKVLDKTQENYNKTLNETVQIKHKLAQEEIKLQQQIELFKQKQEISIKNLEGRYKDLYDKKAIAEYRQELQQLNLDTPDVTNKMKQMALGLKDIEVNAKNNKRALDLANKSAMSFGEAVKIAATKFLIWSGVTVAYYAAVRAMRDGIITVKELDTAMVELKKVTDETDATYQDFMKTAFDLGEQLGRTGKEVINATSDFAKMGYTLENSIGLAEEALLMVNVGDGIKDIDSAASALIATLKGFEVSGEDSVRIARKINDSFNEVANTYAVDTGRLAEGVKRTSAVLNQSGTTLDQTLGLLTGSFEVLQNMEKSATGLITISQRLRAIGEDGETIEGLAPKLEEAFNSIGLTLLDTNGELKSTYDILSDLAQVFPDLTSKQQAYISELVSGKRQAPVLQALMSNWQTVAEATETSMNSMGSAVKENEKYLNSIEGRIAKFQSRLQSFWINAIDSDVIKEIISFGTTIIDILDRMNNIFGILPVTIGVATFAMIAFNTKLKETIVLSKVGTFQNLIHGFQSLLLL